MRKVVLKICSVAFCCGVLAINVFVGGNKPSSKDVNLRGMSVSVHAICVEGSLLSGKCRAAGTQCFLNPGGNLDCDVTVSGAW
jgi:hypothetical protein